MFAALDVHYLADGNARAALVAASSAAFADVAAQRVVAVAGVAAYESGAFWKRELPCLRAVLAGQPGMELLVIDGYVDLDPAGRPGLGARVHAEFGVPVIGVAKTMFRSATHAIPLVRGSSGAVRPLYVTAAGLPAGDAASLVRAMAGRFRLPDALRRVDALARGHAAAMQPAQP